MGNMQISEEREGHNTYKLKQRHLKSTCIVIGPFQVYEFICWSDSTLNMFGNTKYEFTFLGAYGLYAV